MATRKKGALSVRIVGFPAGVFGTNCYIASNEAGECVIIDPGQDSEARIRSEITSSGLRPLAVLVTHGHLDHVWNLQQVADHYRIPTYLHPDDRLLLSQPTKGLSGEFAAMLAGEHFSEPHEVIEVFDGDQLTIGSMVFDVDHVPGHSPGSVAFRISVDDQSDEPSASSDDSSGQREIVFGGDVLFQDGIGRADLPGGDPQVLLESIAKKFLVLDDDTVVLPGHGPTTTVGRERRANPFLKGL